MNEDVLVPLELRGQDEAKEASMKEVPGLYAEFRTRFPEILEKNEELGRLVHEQGGPLDDKTRALVKVGIAAASLHLTSVTTQVARAREAGATEQEIMHALLLVIPTCGFPTFMQAYREYRSE
jgi:alkylhydroperoxidase/carboxymuconolactone decarboxylase family protein YurZ